MIASGAGSEKSGCDGRQASTEPDEGGPDATVNPPLVGVQEVRRCFHERAQGNHRRAQV